MTENIARADEFEGFKIRRLEFQDLRSALRDGFADYFRTPLLSGLFGLLFAAFGLVFAGGLLVFDQIWMIVPAGVGFPLVAPFLAAGLYEMSRRYQSAIPFSWKDIFLIVVKQQRREFGWMAFVVLFIFWVWIYQVRLLLALFLQWTSFSSLEGFFQVVTGTGNGMLFIGVGTLVGAALATVLFSLTVIAMPVLLDREINFVSAMILSVKSVVANRFVLLAWGLMIAAITFASILPLFLGVILMVPVLGHATWHLYVRTIECPD